MIDENHALFWDHEIFDASITKTHNGSNTIAVSGTKN